MSEKDSSLDYLNSRSKKTSKFEAASKSPPKESLELNKVTVEIQKMEREIIELTSNHAALEILSAHLDLIDNPRPAKPENKFDPNEQLDKIFN